MLTLSFVSQNDVEAFKEGGPDGVSEVLRTAIQGVLGIRVKFIAKADAPAEEAPPPLAAEVAEEPAAEPKATDEAGWAVAEIPADPEPEPAKKRSRAKAAEPAEPAAPADAARYGESVVRELLGANFIEEQQVAQRVTPVPKDD